jgi:cysteine desulfurase
MSSPDALIYLDHAATTPVRDEVAMAMEEARQGAFANPSSPHAAGRRAKALLEDCRDRILGLVGATGRGDRLVFTSGATEANRLALLGMAAGIDAGLGAAGGGTTAISAYSARDHASICTAVAELGGRPGWDTVRVPLSPAGTLDVAWFSAWAAARPPGPRLLSTTLVCGQTGGVESCLGESPAVQSLPGTLVHVDATQAVGLLDVAFARLPAATLALAPHKFGGPRGVGGLVVGTGVPFAALAGGPQEGGLRGGTEAVTLAVGFAAALDLTVAERAAEGRRIARLRDRFEARLAAVVGACGAEMHVVGAGGPVAGPHAGDGPARRAPHISTIAFAARAAEGTRGRIDRQAFMMAADLEGVCVATGTACASGSSEPSPALVAMGLGDALVEGAVRFSFGRETTEADTDEAVARLGRVLARMAGG